MSKGNVRMTITIDLSELGGTSGFDEDCGPWYEPGPAFEEAVRERVATAIVNRVGPKFEKAAEVKAEQVIDSMAEVLIAGEIRKVLDAGIQPTDAYGNPKGPKQTFHEVILTALERNVGDHNRGPTLLESTVKKACEEAMRGPLQDTVNKAKKDLQAQLDGEVMNRIKAAFGR